MVRPHGNGFIYNENHLNEMINTIKLCKSLNIDGIVIGCLNESNDLDYHQINYLADYAKPLKVIVHKAIDYSNSVFSSFKNLILNKMDQSVLPGIKENVISDFYLTPDYFEKDLATLHGSGFSIQPKFSQSAYFRFHNQSEVFNNLYFVGAGTHPGAGMPGVLSSAKVLDRLF